jgi:hypothetical protein
MELEMLVTVNRGLVPLYHLKKGDRYRIKDSQCFAEVIDVATVEWPNAINSYRPVALIAQSHKPSVLVSYQAYFPDGRAIHEKSGKYIQLIEPFDKMVRQIK